MFNTYPNDGADRVLLSALWSLVLITQLYANTHQFNPAQPIGIESPELFIKSAVIQLQIMMIVACITLKDRSRFWANLVVAILSLTTLLIGSDQVSSTPIYSTIQMSGLMAIFWVACVRVKIDHILWLLAPPAK